MYHKLAQPRKGDQGCQSALGRGLTICQNRHASLISLWCISTDDLLLLFAAALSTSAVMILAGKATDLLH